MFCSQISLGACRGQKRAWRRSYWSYRALWAAQFGCYALNSDLYQNSTHSELMTHPFGHRQSDFHWAPGVPYKLHHLLREHGHPGEPVFSFQYPGNSPIDLLILAHWRQCWDVGIRVSLKHVSGFYLDVGSLDWEQRKCYDSCSLPHVFNSHWAMIYVSLVIFFSWSIFADCYYCHLSSWVFVLMLLTLAAVGWGGFLSVASEYR